jgi:DNA-binding CsgD family transcriptional regulator
LPLTARDGEHYVAHVLPLDARTRPGNDTRGTVAAVFVCKAALETSSSVEVIRRAYQLTRTELRVLLAIVNVGGIPDVATALGVADCTIKTHVRRLFQKTGTGRQADHAGGPGTSSGIAGGRSTARYSHVAFLLPAAQPFLPGDGEWATIALPHNKIQKCEET